MAPLDGATLRQIVTQLQALVPQALEILRAHGQEVGDLLDAQPDADDSRRADLRKRLDALEQRLIG